jgi:hypothetical protein
MLTAAVQMRTRTDRAHDAPVVGASNNGVHGAAQAGDARDVPNACFSRARRPWHAICVEGRSMVARTVIVLTTLARATPFARVWRVLVASFKPPSPAAPANAPGAAPGMPSWVVGPGARWVRPPGGAPLDLARRGSLRRVLDALVTRRLEEPGVAWSSIALLEAGWPGDRVLHEPGMMRVYSVIRRLRALGWGDALVTRDDGYLIDPEVEVVRAASH